MTAAPGAATRVTAAGVCCVVAALSYSGAVSPFALLAFVLPAVVLVIVVTAVVARLSLRLAAVSGLLAALGLAEIVNLVSGSAHGPAARSTFAAAAFAAFAVAGVLSPAPALFAAAVVGVVVGALGLGAGAEVEPVAVATSVVTVVALAVIEARTRGWTRRTPQLPAAVVLSLLVGGIVAAIGLQAEHRLDGEPAVLSPGAVEPTIRPPELPGVPESQPTQTPADTPSASPMTSPGSDSARRPGEKTFPLRTVWLAVSITILIVLMCVMLRILWVTLAWRRLRRRLRRGTEREQVAGAWVWSSRRLRAAGWPLPRSLTVDAVEAGQGTSALPRAVRRSLREVARSTVAAVYAPPAEDPDLEAAWSAADEVGRGAVNVLPAARRLAFAVRSVNSTPSRSAARAPATPEESRS